MAVHKMDSHFLYFYIVLSKIAVMLAKTVYYVFVINILRCIKKIGKATLFADL